MSSEDRAAIHPCILVPTYDNPITLRSVVVQARDHCPHVIVVDDGSNEAGRRVCDAVAQEGLAHVRRRAHNGGKGAAVKTGFEAASELGFSHVLQVDADGQHDLDRIPVFLAQASARPEALILGYPVYDSTAPRGRVIAREITRFWVGLELGSRDLVKDAMLGFRVYPLGAVMAVPVRGNRMDFDVEIAVRLARVGVPVINLPVAVRYLSEQEGGTSHFQAFGDNLRLSWMHTRLCVGGIFQWFTRRLRLAP